MFWRRPRYEFDVTLTLNGRHPYLEAAHLDYPSQDVTIRVLARDWNDAERRGLFAPIEQKYWSRSVSAISWVRR